MFTINEKVRYSMVNKKGQVPIYEIMNYLQDCSTAQSEMLGAGVNFMKKAGKGWVLISYKIQILSHIKAGQEIDIKTAPTSFKGLFGNRKFCIDDKDGKHLVIADTKWIIIDLETRKPERISQEFIEMYPLEDVLSEVVSVRKIKLADEKTEQKHYPVLKTYIDNNGHMNNADYLRVAEEFLPEDIDINEVDIVYNHEAKQGDMLIPFIHKEEEGIGITFENESGNIFATIKIK